MQDVADHLGISRALVSIALRGVPGASQETRTKVLEAAQLLGYYLDDSAALLRRRRSGQFGVLFTMRQPFEIDLVEALYEQARLANYKIVLSAMSETRTQAEAIDELMRQRIEAMIVLTAENGSGYIDDLPPNLPIVTLGGPVSLGRADDVRVNNAQGLNQMVTHLVELGHKKISYIGPNVGPNAEQRLQGYIKAMKSFGLNKNVQIVDSDFTEIAGHQAATKVLALKDRPSALICANDRCAFGVLETLIRNGVKVPDEISVGGFDDSSVSQLPFIKMTSVHPDPNSMAAAAIKAAHNRITDPENTKWTHRVSTQLAVRETTGKPRS